MKNTLAAGLLSVGIIFSFVSNGFAADKVLDIRIVDNKVSMQAEAIPLGRLLRLLDEATGMKSKVAPELANRNISVRFADLNFEQAVHKIFEGQSLDYIVIQSQGIMVTRPSQNLASKSASYTPPPPEPAYVEENPPFAPPVQQQPGQQPATIQTPFGPMANPNANRNQQPQQNGMSPMVAPGQPGNLNSNPNSFGNGVFGNSLPGFNGPASSPTQQQQPGTFQTPFGPTQQTPPSANPFSSTPFGAPTQPQNPTVPRNP